MNIQLKHVHRSLTVAVHAVESNCSQRGFRVSPEQRYLSSPGYPALVTGNSMCSWKLFPPHGHKVDLYIREYLHRDDTGQQYLRIKELGKNGQSLQLDSTAKRELTSTLNGEVELLLVTDGSTKGHRMWVEYRCKSMEMSYNHSHRAKVVPFVLYKMRITGTQVGTH